MKIVLEGVLLLLRLHAMRLLHGEGFTIFIVQFLRVLVVLRLLHTLNLRKSFERSVYRVCLQNLEQVIALGLGHRVIVAIVFTLARIFLNFLNRLLHAKLKVNHFATFVLWPVVVLLVLNEVVKEEDVPEIDKAISSVRFLGLPTVGRDVQVVEPAFVIHFKILLNIIFGIPARNVADHQIRSRLLSTDDPVVVNRTALVLSRRNE